MACLAICNQALSGAIISVHSCPFYKDLVVLPKFSFIVQSLFLVEMSSTSPCGDAYGFFNAAYLCLLIPPYPVFEIEMKISLV